MYKQIAFGVLLTLIGCAVLVDSTVAYAQLEGALQYPPLSVGEDAQPPPPAGMLRQPVSPRRIELGISGSSVPPGAQQFYIRPPVRLDGPGAPPQSGSGR